MSTWVEPELWYAQLPSFHAAAAGLITATGTDHVLLVKPSYRDDWSLPGGYVEAGEFPRDACARELHEELGLTVNPTRCSSWTGLRRKANAHGRSSA